MTEHVRPIASGEYSEPRVAALLAEMNADFLAAGIVHFTSIEVCLLRKAHPLGKFYAIPPRTWWPRMIRTLVEVAEPLRAGYGGPIEVKAGWRPADYNRAVDGGKNSQHIPFRAVDLNTSDDQRLRELACDLWLTHPTMGLGMYGGHIHVDTGHRHRYWTGKKSGHLAIEIIKARERGEAAAADTVRCKTGEYAAIGEDEP